MPDSMTSASTEETFFNRFAEILDHGAVAVMASIGHRAGLFDVMSGLDRATSQEIAEAANLAERYVREWLAVMTTGRIVDYDPGAGTYRLPPAHAASLTATGAMGNMAVYAQTVALAGAVQDRVLEGFRSGEGIPYGDYPCFHQIMAEDSGQTVVAAIEETLATLAPDLVERLTSGIDVLDAGCGAGRALVKLSQIFPESRFTGYDLCRDAIEMAEAVACEAGVSNVRFEQRDLSYLDAVGQWDLITSFDAVHDTKDPARLLKAYARALRPGGVHLMQDIGGSAALEKNVDFPFAPLLYMISCMHCTPVSLAQDGHGLGTMWGWETALAMLDAAGFASVDRQVLPHDPMNVWFVSRKAAAS